MKYKSPIIVLSLLALATIAPPPNTPAGVYMDPQVVIPVAMLLFFGVRLSSGPLEVVPFRLVVGLFVAVIILGIFSSLVEGQGNFYGTLRLIKALVMLLGAVLFINFVRENWGIDFIRSRIPIWIYLLIGLNGIVMVAEFYSPAFYEFVRKTTLAGGYTSILWDPTGEYRMPGLSLSGGAQISLFQSMGLLMYPILVISERRMTRVMLYSVLLIVNIFSVSISGRSGFYNVAIVAPIIFLLLIYDAHRFNFRKVWKQATAVIVVLGVAVALTGYAIYFPDLIADNYSTTLATAISRNTDFIGGQDAGFLKNATIESLWYDHLIWPTDISTWIFGNPDVMEDRGITRPLESDIGYIIMLHAFGVFSSVLQTLINLVPLLMAIRYRHHAFRLGYATIIVTASVLFFNAKEVMFFTRMAWPMQMFLWCAFVYSLEEYRVDWFQKNRRKLVEHLPRVA
ncbi:MAG: hypothetical protein PSW75_10475 [bacterium]|nr:hypothetical protein [bacterium]